MRLALKSCQLESAAKIMWFSYPVVLLVVDRFLKSASLAKGPVQDAGWFAFSLFKNTGVAFSLPVPNAVFWPLAAGCFAALLVLFVRAIREDVIRAGMAWCVLLGAASNLADRAMYGWTTDYLLFFNMGAWNIADFMIIGGLAALYCRSAKENTSPERA